MIARSVAILALVAALAALPARANPPALTPDGYGDLKIGMSEADALPLLGAREIAPSKSDACRETASLKEPGLEAMFEAGNLTRLSLSGAAGAKTQAGIAVGAMEAMVYKAYPELRSDGGFSDDGAPWQDLYVEPHGREQRGLRFAMDGKGKVAAIYAGGPSIAYRNGCS